MANVTIHDDDLTLDDPILVEGLPGVGLVGKIAADHVVDAFDMTHYASLYCDGLPEIAVYGDGGTGVKAPVRLYADEERDLLVLRSDVPVSPSGAEEFAGCVTGWLDASGVTPIYLSGLPVEKDEAVPSVWGIATGDGDTLLDEADLDGPGQEGAVTGPTGALLHRAERIDLDGVGVVVEADPQFPDPEAARVVLREAVEPIADVEIDTDSLVERAQEIGEAKAELAKRMEDAGDESSQARPLGMYQ